MRPRPGVRMGACESSPQRRPGLLVHDPVPVLAGVKVLPPPGRFTLTPAAAGELSRYGKPNKPRLRAGRALLRLLTEPDPMGAKMQVGMALTPNSLARRKPGVQIPSPPPPTLQVRASPASSRRCSLHLAAALRPQAQVPAQPGRLSEAR